MITERMRTSTKFLRQMTYCDNAITHSSNPPDSLQAHTCSSTHSSRRKIELKQIEDKLYTVHSKGIGGVSSPRDVFG